MELSNIIHLSKRDALELAKKTSNIYEIIELTKHSNPDVRLSAVKQLCPCKVLEDIDEFWEQLFTMVDDEDDRIRARVMHIVCDGSPTRLEDKVIDAVESFNRDKNPEIRRKAHKVLGTYKKTGKWNIL